MSYTATTLKQSSQKPVTVGFAHVSYRSDVIVASQEPLAETRSWHEAGSSTVRVPQSVLQLLERWYVFRKRREVLAFIEYFPFIVPLLLESYEILAAFFPQSPLFLEVCTAPTSPDDSRFIVFIATHLPPAIALAQLDQVDEQWWFHAMQRGCGKVAIALEHQ